MQLGIIAVGQMHGAWEMPLVEDFRRRIEVSGRQLGISDLTILELREKRGLTGGEKKRSENALIADALARRNGPLIVLDETGKSLTSRAFADRLQGWIESGDSDVTFVIGGADGLDDTIRARADMVLSFGPMTWPHMLARVLLCEQIWRAVSILTRHPYHRD
ncbi:MAG: 23S rRNA (pseudouridine(1915)-N(3))-methyltransferase RlmH [Pseudomonadota bacterium]|nr:23S rRNA (pseudouridine(1915)-N(3))-methyltransferase RlmH [Pseudomonadota bacterium]